MKFSPALTALISIARKYATARGHKLRPFRVTRKWDPVAGGGQWVPIPTRAESVCVNCAHDVSVDVNPPPNGVAVSGPAVAVKCEYRAAGNMLANLDAFAEHYERAALWASTDNADDSGGAPLDDVKYADRLTRGAREQMRIDCAEWIRENAALLAELAAAADDAGYGSHPDCRSRGGVADWVGAAGHDFWLTRNHHGCGFWDRGLGELGDRLTAAAHGAGETSLYVAKGWIYHE